MRPAIVRGLSGRPKKVVTPAACEEIRTSPKDSWDSVALKRVHIRSGIRRRAKEDRHI
jgi:hypothetical protein